MISRGPDPLNDFYRYDTECMEAEEKFPTCDACGNRITDEEYYEVVYKGRTLRFHEDCVSRQYTSNYIEEKEGFQEV